MPGPISTNAPFNVFGNSMILRDIEQLYLLIPQQNGDLGKQVLKSGDVSGNVVNNSGSGSSSSTTVNYLGTLDLPVFVKITGSGNVLGNARGQYAVDWQQFRLSATSVASGIASTIPGGYRCTASGDYSFASGLGCVASGVYGFAVGSFCNASATAGVALGNQSAATGLYDVAAGDRLTASGGGSFASGGTKSTASGINSVNLGGDTTIVSGASSMVCGGQQTTLSGSKSFLFGGISVTYVGENSVFFPMNQGYTGSSLISGVFLVGVSGLVNSGLGLISNSVTMHTGGLSNVSSSATGGLTQAFALSSSIFSSLTTVSSKIFAFNSTVNCANQVNGIVALNNSSLTNTGAAAFNVNAINSTADLNGLSNVTLINSTGTVPTGSCTYISVTMSGLPYTPVSSSTLLGGELFVKTKFGCNNKTPQSAIGLGFAAIDLATVIALANNIRTGLINNGIAV
jgi:hypothetical protein